MNHLAFIRDMFAYLKKSRRFTARAFMKEAGFRSPSYLNMVISGRRKLTSDSVQKMAEGLFLLKGEASYFTRLVLYNQSQSYDEKDIHYRELLRFRGIDQARKQEFFAYEYFSKWYIAALFVALGTDLRKKRPPEIAQALGVSEDDYTHAIDVLRGLHLIEKQEGYWRSRGVVLETPPETQSLYVRNFHKQMIQKALTTLDGLNTKDRSMQAVTLILTEEEFEDLKKQMTSFRENMGSRYAERRPKIQGVYQLNLQLFPLVKATSTS